jgi:hypothetical protein
MNTTIFRVVLPFGIVYYICTYYIDDKSHRIHAYTVIPRYSSGYVPKKCREYGNRE